MVQREVVTPEVLRSFNDTFCRLYFSNEIVIESYVNYIEIIFADSDPQNLKKRFEFTCCKREDSESHYPECGEKWQALKIYLEQDMLNDLGVLKATQNIENFEEGSFEDGF